MELFAQALESHREQLNSLNVYPVPDGDTGTNLLLTQQAVTSALESSAGEFEIEAVAAVVSRTSLMGARGNSGVILSQVLRGMGEALGARSEVGGEQLAAALEHATHEAYRAVTKPAEGTMLSVLRDAAVAARAASTNDDGGTVLSASLGTARKSLNRTRTSNPDLRQAGVTDAGGKGIVLFLDALLSAVTGEPMTEPIGPLGPVGTQPHALLSATSRPGYEVQYLIEGGSDAVAELREALQTLGESVVLVGGGGLFNVHVHTDDPESVIQAGEREGVLHDISVVSLGEQVEACMAGQARAVRVAEETSMVALADGDGVVRALESLGALVVRGGTGTPPLEEVVAAINRAPVDAVLVLPNHPQAVTTAERAATESLKRAVVVPTRSVPTALSAAAAFNPVADVEENLRSIKEVLAASRSGEISRPEDEGAESSGGARTGNWSGVADERVVYTGPSLEHATEAVITHLLRPEAELLTLIVGASALREDEEAVLEAIGRVT
ncbi:MAG TPA: DAK2 domain-containing protein, partial [Actinomycetota bacterium]|nr:DAK2 domain-containing protein [Actinomycetota bacterium]